MAQYAICGAGIIIVALVIGVLQFRSSQSGTKLKHSNALKDEHRDPNNWVGGGNQIPEDN